MEIYLYDEISYDNRGGEAVAFATLEGAQSRQPNAEWEHMLNYDGEHEWHAAGVSRDSITPLPFIRRVSLRP